MPRVVVTHNVADLQRWLQGKEERAQAIGSIGSNVTDYVAQDGSNQVAITADFEDTDALTSMLTSPPPETMELMQKHGVQPPVLVYIEA